MNNFLNIVQLCGEHGRPLPCNKCDAAPPAIPPIVPAAVMPARVPPKSLLDYALDALHRGWFVLPCYPRKKTPAGEVVPHGVLDASNDEAVIRAWWAKNPNYNPAVALGPSNLVVFDFDTIAPWAHLEPTFTVQTGRAPVNGTHGIQMYYSGSCETHDIPGPDGEAVGEVRGRGAYVMLFGAIHPKTGNPYLIINDAPLAKSPENSVAKPIVKGEPVGSDEQNEIAYYVESAFDAAGIDYLPPTGHQGGFKWLIACPWKESHTGGKDFNTSSAVIMWPDGKLVYACQHAHCKGSHLWVEQPGHEGDPLYMGLRKWMENAVGGKLVFGVGSEDSVTFDGRMGNPSGAERPVPAESQVSLPVVPEGAGTAFVFETAADVTYMRELGLQGAEQNTQTVEVLRTYDRVLLFGTAAETKALAIAISTGASMFDLPANEAAMPESRYGRKVYPPYTTMAEAIRAHDNDFGGREALLEYFQGLEKLEAVRALSTKPKAPSTPPPAAVPPVALSTTGDKTDTIPPFDPSVMEGTIYEKFVRLVTDGTTLLPQYSYQMAKLVFGAVLAGTIEFDGVSGIQPLRRLVMLGATGTGKGETYRRSEIILKTGRMDQCRMKITDSIDSGAGLKDFFLEPPQHLPVLVYIDEAATLGHKGSEKKNPDILDAIGELADRYVVSRTKSKKGKALPSVTLSGAHLVTVICAQDGLAFMCATAGRKSAGFNDRQHPVFERPVRPGKKPKIPVEKILAWWEDVDTLCRMVGSRTQPGMVTMAGDAEAAIEAYWETQPKEIQTKVRFKNYLQIDAYMNAVARGRMEANLRDAQDAIIESRRELATRAACFVEEVSDRVGFYFLAMREIEDRMAEAIRAAGPDCDPFEYGKSERDFWDETRARKNNEPEQFSRAWKIFSSLMGRVKRKAKNGKEVTRYIPPEAER